MEKRNPSFGTPYLGMGVSEAAPRTDCLGASDRSELLDGEKMEGAGTATPDAGPNRLGPADAVGGVGAEVDVVVDLALESLEGCSAANRTAPDSGVGGAGATRTLGAGCEGRWPCAGGSFSEKALAFCCGKS